MTITLHWWAVPTFITACFLIWAFIPKYQSSMWGDLETFFAGWIGAFIVVLSWAIAGVFIK